MDLGSTLKDREVNIDSDRNISTTTHMRGQYDEVATVRDRHNERECHRKHKK